MAVWTRIIDGKRIFEEPGSSGAGVLKGPR